MVRSITPGQIKHTNRQLIYDYIYHNDKVSQQDISYALRLSRPTVASNLAKLEDDGLIFKNGLQQSDLIGRKATCYSIVADHRVAIGVELMRKVAKVIAIDLYGEKIERRVLDIQYEDKDAYYRKVSDFILKLIRDLHFKDEQILGIGFSLQGLVSSDGTSIVYGVILGNTGVKTSVFSKYLPYPCTFIHDPEGAALSELWKSPELRNGIYVSLSRHLGGAMINNGQVHAGNHGHNATFEHMIMRPNGKPCYCGKRGCAETLCSMEALLEDEDPDVFFENVRNGNSDAKKRWKTYLDNLAKLLSALHLFRDVDIILGGHLAPYLTMDDIRYLYDEVRELIPFDEEDDYIVLSKMPSHNITIGAALVYVRNFLDDIDKGGRAG